MRRTERRLLQLSDELTRLRRAAELTAGELEMHRHLDDDARRDAVVSGAPLERAETRVRPYPGENARSKRRGGIRAGGVRCVDGDTATLATAEIYDPSTGTWSSAGTMSTPRVFQTATLLPDGKVLVAGGSNSSQPLATAEMYDPVTGAWTRAGTMVKGRYYQMAAPLLDGSVLVVGGSDGTSDLASAELYGRA